MRALVEPSSKVQVAGLAARTSSLICSQPAPCLFPILASRRFSNRRASAIFVPPRCGPQRQSRGVPPSLHLYPWLPCRASPGKDPEVLTSVRTGFARSRTTNATQFSEAPPAGCLKGGATETLSRGALSGLLTSRMLEHRFMPHHGLLASNCVFSAQGVAKRRRANASLALGKGSGGVGGGGAALPRNAVVVGGGLAGLAAALALRAIGVDVQVYERRPVIAGGEGTMITITPNGLRALADIHPDIPQKILSAGCPSPGALNLTFDGTETGRRRMGHTTDGKLKYGLPFVLISWNNTLQAMRDLLPSSCLHTAHAFVDLTEDPEGATVVFQRDGGELVEAKADLVVGADGIRSRVRGALFGIGSEQIQDMGRTMWRALLEFDSTPIPGVEQGHSYAILGGPKTLLVADSGSNLLYIAFAALDSAWDGETPRRSRDGEEALAVLRKMYKGCKLAEHTLQVLPPGDILERRVEQSPTLDKWASERAILIGDAAHALPPSIGQGANSAFEDARDLAAFLSLGESISSTLSAFEQQRKERLQFITALNTAAANNAYKNVGSSAPFASWEELYSYVGVDESQIVKNMT